MEKIIAAQPATQDELRQDLSAPFRGAIRLTLERVLEEEADDLITEAHVQGVSQRGMGGVTEALMGERVSRSTVSRTAKKLDQAVTELKQRPIEGPHPYLYLDTAYLDARWARKVENVSALVAYGVGRTGVGALGGSPSARRSPRTAGPSSSADSWSEDSRGSNSSSPTSTRAWPRPYVASCPRPSAGDAPFISNATWCPRRRAGCLSVGPARSRPSSGPRG